jgi:hypothetical protein
MDIVTHDYLLRDTSGAKHTAERAAKKRGNNTMPDNKGVGWRKKIHSKPRELPQPKGNAEDVAGAEDSTDRRRHGWRKTIQGSRPATPVSGPPATPIDDTEDAQSERIAASTPRRDSKPKLIRYTSLFSSFKDASKEPKVLSFAEPWDDSITPFQSYLDPWHTIQSIRSHMLGFSMIPIPLEHNSSLFRIFEDYHRLKDENERLDITLQKTRQSLQYYEDQWVKEERRYGEEIRRLELLIARGATGVAWYVPALSSESSTNRRTVS